MRTPPLNVLVAARNAYRRTGILPSVQLAQWALESAWGTRASGRNNFFGIKAKPGEDCTICWTHEVVNGQLKPLQADFKNYASVDEAFLDHADLLCRGPYAVDAPLKPSYAAFCKAIAPHYATDPDYGQKLVDLIRSQRLDQYDQPIKGAA